MCWQFPRKIFLRLGGLAIKPVISVVPQRLFLHTAPLSTLLSFCSTLTLHYCRHLICCNIQIQELFTCGRPIFLFRRLAQFCARCFWFWASLRTGYELEKFAFLKKCRLNFNVLTNPVHLVYWPKFHEFLKTCEIVFFTWIFIVTILQSLEDYRLQMQLYSYICFVIRTSRLNCRFAKIGKLLSR